MVSAIKQRVRIQAGGKVELISSDLPAGREAEVIVLLSDDVGGSLTCAGAFADAPEVIDQVLAEAMAAREHPMRAPRG